MGPDHDRESLGHIFFHQTQMIPPMSKKWKIAGINFDRMHMDHYIEIEVFGTPAS